MKRSLCLVVFFSILLMVPCDLLAWSRSSSSVAPDSEYYRDLDKIVAAKLAKPAILGQRPYPRSEFARMAIEAGRKLQEIEEDRAKTYSELIKRDHHLWQARLSLRKLEKEFAEDIADLESPSGELERYRVHPFEKVYMAGRYLNSPTTDIINNNGRGWLSAEINPLADYNLGRHPIDGGTVSLEPVARFQATKFLSGYVQPRFEADMYRSGEGQGHAYVQNAYATFKAGNFSFKAGRESQLWGYGDRGSLLYSTNPRPMDGMWVTNPTPARLPWIFKYLGKWRYTLYGVNLGPEQVRSWPWLAGYKLGLLASDYFELGFGHSVMMGGDGSITPSFIDVVGEFFGFRPAGTSPGSPNLTNHIFEVDMLLRLVPLRGTQIYGGFAIDDKWSNVRKTLKHGMSYQGGIYFPALNESGSMDLRIEYVRTSPLQYRHSRYRDGYTENRKIIGTDLGPDGDSIHVGFRQTLSENTWLGLSFDWEYRRSDRYREVKLPDGHAGDVIKIASGPTDTRYRGMLDFNFNASKNVKVNLAAGYERAVNISYIEGDDRNNYLLGARFEINLDRYFGFSKN